MQLACTSAKAIIKTLKTSSRCFSVFIVHFEDFSNVFLVFLLTTLNVYLPAENVCYNDSNRSGTSMRNHCSNLPNTLNHTSN